MEENSKRVVHVLNNQKYIGVIENYTHRFYHKSEVCGDINIIYIKVEDDVIEEISYEAFGCAINIYVLEKLCESIIGKNKNSIKNLNLNSLTSDIEVPEDKLHCRKLVFDIIESNKENL